MQLFSGENRPIIETRDLIKIYGETAGVVPALNGISIHIESGEFVAVMGASGSGKSTLLYLIGGLAEPTAGEVLIGGTSISNLPDAERARIRNTRIGFVFQRFNLLGFLSAEDNIKVPSLLGWKLPQAPRKTRDLLTAVGLGSKRLRRVNELSAGEQQRVAIARALINNPSILLADEPTGNLDSRNAAAVLDLLLRLKQEFGLTILMVTHNPEAAIRTDRIIEMKDGAIERELRPIAKGRLDEDIGSLTQGPSR